MAIVIVIIVIIIVIGEGGRGRREDGGADLPRRNAMVTCGACMALEIVIWNMPTSGTLSPLS